MTSITEFRIKALRSALEAARHELKATSNVQRKPWREDTEEVDNIGNAQAVVIELENEIIALERSLRDPIQDAEMRAEMAAEIRLMGGDMSDVDNYFNTPMEEERFQRGISHDIDYGYIDSDGHFVEGMFSRPGKCCCNLPLWDDDAYCVEGHNMCYECSEDALAFLHLLCWLSGLSVEECRYGEWQIARADTDGAHV